MSTKTSSNIPKYRMIDLHFHNTRGVGLACVMAGLDEGVDRYESSFGGIGGCPFAPGAAGNVPTEDLLYMLHRSGYATGISLDAAIETAAWLQARLGRTVPGTLLKAGPFPRATAGSGEIA